MPYIWENRWSTTFNFTLSLSFHGIIGWLVPVPKNYSLIKHYIGFILYISNMFLLGGSALFITTQVGNSFSSFIWIRVDPMWMVSVHIWIYEEYSGVFISLR